LFFRTRAEREVDFPSERLAATSTARMYASLEAVISTQELHDGDQRPFDTRCARDADVVGAVHEILEQRVMDLLTLGELVP
jgi:hypothetical protein